MLTDQQLRGCDLKLRERYNKSIGIFTDLGGAAWKKDDWNVTIVFDMLHTLVKMIRNDKTATDEKIVHFSGQRKFN